MPSQQRRLGGLVCLVLTLASTPATAQDCSNNETTRTLARVGEAAELAPGLPDCASGLMRQIYEASVGVAAKGTVPLELFATQHNWADPRPRQEGTEIFGAKADVIAEAQREVLIETFVWEPDTEPVNRLLDGIRRLEAQRKRNAKPGDPPVVVRILIDASDTGLYALPFPVGVQYATESLRSLSVDPELVQFEVAAFPHMLTGNLHVKHVVVDGRVAVTSGANPEIHHQGDNPWYDLGWVFRGEVAHALRGEFADAWRRAVQWTCPTWDFFPESCSRPTRALPELVVPIEPDLADACLPMLVIGRGADENPLGNSSDNTQDQAYLAAMRHSNRVIRIQTPNFNDDEVKDSLLEAIERGANVRLILSRDFNRLSESLPGPLHDIVGGHNEHNVNEIYRRLAAAGVENPCERMQIRWYSQDGEKPQRGNGPGASHAKYASFDDQVAIVGGTNMDKQSFHRSREADVVVDDKNIVGSWDRLFEEKFSNGIEVEPCGGPAPMFPSDSWGAMLERLSLQALNKPRHPPKPFTFVRGRLGKQLGLWHLGARFGHTRVRDYDEERYDNWSQITLLGTRRLGFDHSRFWFAEFDYESDHVWRDETRSRWHTGVRQQTAPWGAARLELDVGPGYVRRVAEDGVVEQGLMLDAAARFGWMISRDLALRQEVGTQLGTDSHVYGNLGVGTTLTKRWRAELDARFRFDGVVDPFFRLGFQYRL